VFPYRVSRLLNLVLDFNPWVKNLSSEEKRNAILGRDAGECGYADLFWLGAYGLPDLVSQRIGILLLFVAPALNIAALFGAREDTLFGLWIRAKKQKFRRELDRGKNSPR